MILDRKHFCFLAQVTDRDHLNAAGGCMEGRVLNIFGTNGSCLHEKGPDKGHIDDKYGFLLLTPVGTSKSLEDVDMG